MIKLSDKIRRIVTYYMNRCDTNDPFIIAKFLNIEVMEVPLGKIAGSYMYMQRKKWIFINSDIENGIYKRVVMAHELGHAILHPWENCCFMAHYTMLLTSRIEVQANLFAAELIITDDMLKEFSGFTIDQFSNCTGMPRELITMRLNSQKAF